MLIIFPSLKFYPIHSTLTNTHSPIPNISVIPSRVHFPIPSIYTTTHFPIAHISALPFPLSIQLTPISPGAAATHRAYQCSEGAGAGLSRPPRCLRPPATSQLLVMMVVGLAEGCCGNAVLGLNFCYVLMDFYWTLNEEQDFYSSTQTYLISQELFFI